MTIYNDEVDLRPYILTLVRRWWVVALATILPVVLGVVASQILPLQYEGTATLLLTRSRPTLSLADQFPTVNEPIDTFSRMEALLAIARSDAITQKTLARLGDRLPPELQNIDGLQEAVVIDNVGDAIQIVAAADDPQLAADIANTWAQEASQAINLAYSGEQPLSEIQRQLDAARTAYEDAQAKLEAFIAQNQKKLLKSQIAATESLLQNLTDNQATLIAYYDQRRQMMETFLVQAQALKRQLEQGSQSTAGRLGDALAVLNARANLTGIQEQIPLQRSPLDRAFTPASLPIDIQLLDPAALTATNDQFANDINILINLAEEEKATAEQAIAALSQEATQDAQRSLQEAVASQLQDLETQLEQETATELQLTSERDVAWEAYQALAQKEVEILNAAQAESLVTVASVAIPPSEPASRGILTLTAVAGLLGLILSTAWIVARQWWRTAILEQPTDEQVNP